MRRAAVVALFFMLLAAKPAGPRVFKANESKDLEDIVRVLRRHVAHVRAHVIPEADDPFGDRERDGFGIAIASNRVAMLSFIVDGATKVEITGPSGRSISGKVILHDVERRVAIVETAERVDRAGLIPVEMAPKTQLHEGEDVFALTSISEEATVAHGVFMYVGDDPEYGGHHRVDLKLSDGMPVFDSIARFVGYSRAVAWDPDKSMLVTPELIASARTATAAAAKQKDQPPAPKRPWWSK